MPAAARVTDKHVCPQATTTPVPVPHVGGVIAPPGVMTITIGYQPAATKGSICTCGPGSPNEIKSGSTTVSFAYQDAARMLDPTSHGGSIMTGDPSVLIG